MFKLLKYLNYSEIYSIIILIIYCLIAIVNIELFYVNILINLTLVLGVVSISHFFKYKSTPTYTSIRFVLLLPLIFIIYSQIQDYINYFHTDIFDELLIKIDHYIFGLNPTEYLHNKSNKVLTEYLQISYFVFYLMPLINVFELIKRNKNNYNHYSRVLFFSFYFSYLLYLFMPAIGPRFTIHNFELINSELPGLFFTEYLREIINIGGGIVNNVLPASEIVNRDCMPSGHTMMTLLNIIFAFKFKSRIKYVHLIMGLSLIFSTVYLRYHYVIDVFAGVLFAFIALKLELVIYKLLESAKQKIKT